MSEMTPEMESLNAGLKATWMAGLRPPDKMRCARPGVIAQLIAAPVGRFGG